MHAVPLHAAGQLHAGDQGQAGRQRLLRPHHPAQGPPRLGVAGQRVVVGEREDVEAGLPGAAHHLGRRIRAVRGRAVAVQVDAHERSC